MLSWNRNEYEEALWNLVHLGRKWKELDLKNIDFRDFVYCQINIGHGHAGDGE